MTNYIDIETKNDIFALTTRLKDYFDSGKTKTIRLYYKPPSKSHEQLKGIHQLFKMAGELLNEDKDNVKEYYKAKIGKKETFTGLDKEPITRIVSLADYSKHEMCEFIEAVITDLKTEYQVDVCLTDKQWLGYYEDYLTSKGV